MPVEFSDCPGQCALIRKRDSRWRRATYRSHILRGELRVPPDEVSEAAFFPRDELPPLDELAWPSTIHGLDAWKAFEREKPRVTAHFR